MPCWRRQKTKTCRFGEVADKNVGTATARIEETITSFRLSRSAKTPMRGAEIATPRVEALIVRPTTPLLASNILCKTGSRGCVA